MSLAYSKAKISRTLINAGSSFTLTYWNFNPYSSAVMFFTSSSLTPFSWAKAFLNLVVPTPDFKLYWPNLLNKSLVIGWYPVEKPPV